jgi:hypothetical protein
MSPTASADVVSRTPLDFTGSQWIWSPNVLNGVPPVAFRKTWSPPQGKTALYADIIITADNVVVLYVNGKFITEDHDWRVAGRFRIDIASGPNVFAARATCLGGEYGLLAAIRVTYDDGSTSIIRTDTTWRASQTIPVNFEKLSFDDSSWGAAVSKGNYGTGIWGSITTPGDPRNLSFGNAAWIWFNSMANVIAPVAACAFRKTFRFPDGQDTMHAYIVITVDNEYTLYVNDVLVGAGANWTTPQRYFIRNVRGPTVTIAVNAYNQGLGPHLIDSNPAGVLAAISFSDRTSTVNLISDATWKVNLRMPKGWESPGFDDSAWSAAAVIGGHGMLPWGNLTLPPNPTVYSFPDP